MIRNSKHCIQLTISRSLCLIFTNVIKRIVTACRVLESNHRHPFSLRDLVVALLYETARTPLNLYIYATLDKVSVVSFEHDVDLLTCWDLGRMGFP